MRYLPLALSMMAVVPQLSAQVPNGETLPGTLPLQLKEPLDVVMVRGISNFAERELAHAAEQRSQYWHRDYSSLDAYVRSIASNRKRLKEILGVVNPLEEKPALFGFDPAHASHVQTNDPNENLVIHPVRWSVTEGISAEGYLVTKPPGNQKSSKPFRALVVVIPDADQSVESLLGLDNKLPPDQQLARRLAEHHCLVLTLSLISRRDELSGHADIRYTNMPHREYVYRTSFELGRHIIGYEVEKAITGLRSLRSIAAMLTEPTPDKTAPTEKIPTALFGIGEGGLLALYAGAVEPAFDTVFVAGYFQPREKLWQEPIYRNVWNLLSEFSDADIASLIAPRTLIIDPSPAPEVTGPLEARPGRRGCAAPGVIRNPAYHDVQAEYQRARPHFEKLGLAENLVLLKPASSDSAPERSLRQLLQAFSIPDVRPSGSQRSASPSAAAWAAEQQHAREKRQLGELIRHTQMLLHRSDKVRERFWTRADRSQLGKWTGTSDWYRDYVHDHLIGRLPRPTAPLHPRSRKILDEPTHVGYEVVLDVFPRDDSESGPPSKNSGMVPDDPGIIAGGILLIPKDLRAGERRPVVVCQHGLEGTPMDTILTDPSQRAWRAYKGFSTVLVKRGFIVYAPQNPYRGGDDFRVIQRKSNPLGRSLFSYIIEQHRQTLKWLATLPFVDARRIGFYGLSYGGKTAVRVPPLLPPSENEPGYCLSICSADYNEWIRKNVSAEDRYSYVYTGEYEMFEWNMGHVAGYAELASLMVPRPFMVERGHNDGVAPDEWVAWEFAKVRRLYDQLGIGDKTEIEWFNGPHTINGQGTFRFLHRHLNWQER